MSHSFRRAFCRAACLLALAGLALPSKAPAQSWINTDDDTKTNRSTFRSLEDWPDPNDYRNAAGSPGPRYWQQQVDYVIEAVLDTTEHAMSGSERITYHNNSPDVLRYVWVQLDQNVRSLEHSRAYRQQGALPEQVNPQFAQFVGLDPFDGGFELSRVQVEDASGRMVDADHFINDTVLKIQLARPLQPGEATHLEMDWRFRIHPNGLRGGRERVSDGWIYEMAQWYPRLAVYDDVNGWQTDQFFGRGEFYLNFGNYDVRLTVPWNHILDATGVLQNPEEVLTATQRERLTRAYRSEEPVFIVSADEVMDPAARPVQRGTLTWHFKAENVRDFAWASSKTFVWDAAGFRYEAGAEPVHLHSLYPRDAMPLWDKVSTKAIAQTMRTYGQFAFPYPYPKAVNVNGPAFGMEYPMMAFCGSRPMPGGIVPPPIENTLVTVTIHEVGHNWYPMIVASDERKHAWMDEGINSFVQYYAEQAWDPQFPSWWGPAPLIVPYMRSAEQVPIMIHSDLIRQQEYGNNAYAKPAAGLVLLREHVLGPERFDQAFAEYSQKWMFKHPQPADFFRSIEEGAGEDLAWFWRGWFYTTHANDQALASVTAQPTDSLLGSSERGRNYYRIEVTNEGGLLMPVDLAVTYDDGTTEQMHLPVDVWRNDEKSFKKGFFTDRTVVKVELDPDEAFADIDRTNNLWEAPEVSNVE